MLQDRGPASFRGILAAVPLMFIGIVLCRLGVHSDTPFPLLSGLLLVPAVVLIRPIIARYIGESGTWGAFCFHQGAYYVIVFGLVGRLRRRARS